jgi:hypothetical protein
VHITACVFVTTIELVKLLSLVTHRLKLMISVGSFNNAWVISLALLMGNDHADEVGGLGQSGSKLDKQALRFDLHLG